MSGGALDQLLQLTDPKGCRITALPKRLWVFGGPCNPDPKEPSWSLRDSFWRQTLRMHPSPNWLKSLDRPEGHPDWFHFSGYSDLLEFERDACYLANGVVLFAESPGAHAELGALAIDQSILPRLLVVVQSKYLDHDNRNSFLNLGPLQRVYGAGGRCVIGTEGKIDLPEDDFATVTDFKGTWLPHSAHTKKLEVDNPTHRLLLIADLVDLLLVSRIPDIHLALNNFGVEISDQQLKKSLDLLAFFELIAREERGREVFWVRSARSDGPWAEYSGVADSRFDRMRFKITVNELVGSDRARKAIYERLPK